jgi:hypothetical protein
MGTTAQRLVHRYRVQSAGRRGLAQAAILKGAWRRTPPLLDCPLEVLGTAAPPLLQTGAGGLAWWRVRNSCLRDTAPALELRQAYRLHSLRAALCRREVARVVALLRAYGIETLLIKGAAVAQAYPESGLRPCGDIDLWVAPGHLTQAEALVRARPGHYALELSTGYPRFRDLSFADLRSRARSLMLEGIEVLVPGPEDHLRLLCLHWLQHGAWRPLWLCDVALGVESRSWDFDWDLLLGSDPREAGWVRAALGLTRQLLGADPAGTQLLEWEAALPRWLPRAVLRQWGEGPGASAVGPFTGFQEKGRFSVSCLGERTRVHLRNPIQATVELGVAFDERPRLPYQAAATLARLRQWLQEKSHPMGSRR